MSERITFTAFLEDSMSSKFGAISHAGTSTFDKLSVSLNKVHSGARNASKSIGEIGNQVPKSVGKIEYLESKLKLLEHRRRIAVDDSQIRKLNKEIDYTQTRLTKLTTVKSGGSMLGGMLPMLGGAGMILGGVSLGKSMISTRGEIEKHEAVLKNTLGSELAMRKAMDDIIVFGAKTPFSVNELTSSYVKLTNQGLQPTMEQMTKYGDLASSVGKSFDQLTEGIIDATVGEFERLKEFGIKASKEGNQITFMFKGQKTVVDNTSESIQKYILSLGEMKGVSGSMEAISKTLNGQISNLGDSWDQLLNTMGKSHGVFSSIISGLTGIMNQITNVMKVDDQLANRGFKLPEKDFAGQLSQSIWGPDANDIMMKSKLVGLNAGVNEFFKDFDKKLAANSTDVFERSKKIGSIIRSGLGEDAYLKFMNEFMGQVNLTKKTANPLVPDAPGGGPGGGKDKKDKLTAGLDSVSGDSGKIRNLTINIDKQIEKVEVNSTTAVGAIGDFTAKLKEALLTVVNDANYAVE